MKEIPLQIAGGTRFARYPQISSEATINMMVSGNSLVPYAGHKSVRTFPSTGDARAIFKSTKYDHLIVVVGRDIYTLSTALGFSRVGTLSSESGPVFISENDANQIALVDGIKLHVFNYENGTFGVVNTPFSPSYITFQDGYLIAASLGTSRWYISGINDAFSWNALDFQAVQTKADRIVAVYQFNRQLFVFGAKVTEVWHDQGLPPPLFPFVRDNALSIGMGCIAAETISSNKDILVWLGSNENSSPGIFYSTGGVPKSITTDGLDFLLDKIKKPELATAFLYEEDGHTFYHITFPTEDLSFVYDFTTKLFYTVTDKCLTKPHIAKKIAFFNNTHYFISSIDTKIYELGTEITTYDGQLIPRVRITPTIRNPNDQKFIVDRVVLQLEQGDNEGLSRVDLSQSKDGGYCYGAVFGKELAPLGVRSRQLRYWQLGACKSYTPQFRFWGSGRFVVTSATIGVTGGEA